MSSILQFNQFLNKYQCAALYRMSEEVKEISKEEPKKKGFFGKIKEAATDNESQLEAISTMVRLGILVWSGGILTLEIGRAHV